MSARQVVRSRLSFFFSIGGTPAPDNFLLRERTPVPDRHLRFSTRSDLPPHTRSDLPPRTRYPTSNYRSSSDNTHRPPIDALNISTHPDSWPGPDRTRGLVRTGWVIHTPVLDSHLRGPTNLTPGCSCGVNVFGHITLNTPVLVRSLKLRLRPVSTWMGDCLGEYRLLLTFCLFCTALMSVYVGRLRATFVIFLRGPNLLTFFHSATGRDRSECLTIFLSTFSTFQTSAGFCQVGKANPGSFASAGTHLQDFYRISTGFCSYFCHLFKSP